MAIGLTNHQFNLIIHLNLTFENDFLTFLPFFEFLVYSGALESAQTLMSSNYINWRN